MKIERLCLVTGVLLSCALPTLEAQANRPPRFSVGGDMAHFSIPENVDVGSTIYKLRGTDPEGGSVYFSISGEYFSVNKHTGDVTLIKELDRELSSSVEVIISITDEPKYDSEANTISIRREIPIIDVNDNPPVFTGSQYSLSVLESTKVGTTVYTNITISDRDSGVNAMVNLFCVQSPACQIFSASLQVLSEGFYKGIITLTKPLNYEIQSSHTLWLKAIDSNSRNPQSATVKVIIDVVDVQDQPPIFSNTPYSISVPENVPADKVVLRVEARDGDVNNLRSLHFSLEEETLGYFSLRNHGNGNASLVTTDKKIDRENPVIVQMGGIYTFYVKATEMVNDDLTGDETKELITIVILDDNDQLPRFNKETFNVIVSEDISVGTPLPGLGLIASDDDAGDNARFSLSVRASDSRFSDCFTVEPTEVMRRSPVIIRVSNNSNLDYEAGVRNIKLYVIAFVPADHQDELMETAIAEIILNITDVNDNAPEFKETNFVVDVPENATRGTIIANISAVDRDSGLFSQISYSVGGFGMEKFDTDPRNGGLILVSKLDYEQQISYSLTLEARDGGNRTTTANIVVNVLDVNDNAPIFEQSEYRRNIREGSSVLQPQFFVKATDIDGRRNNNITYSIVSSNSEVISVDKYTGELKLLSPVSSQHTAKGQYELKIQASDAGMPPRSSETQVFIRVGSPGNQRPVFKGTPYNITIPETLTANSFVTTVRASDPDGLDETLEYKIAADADNFYIKPKSGMIYLAEKADLSVYLSPPRKYSFKVLAIDNGTPFRETAQATVTVNIIDINNKPPAFNKSENYVAYLLEEMPIGTVVMKVRAVDPDENANVQYKLLKPFQVSDKRGFLLKQESNDFNQLFSINETNGEISVRQSLQNLAVHVITVRIEARDKNAAKNVEDQVDTAEATFFIEATDDVKPVFLNSGWMRSHPIITHSMPEEMPIGSNVITISAQDRVTASPISKFRVRSLPRQLAMDPVGNIVITERIDYETILSKELFFVVEAISDDNKRISESNVTIHVVDVNDHTPQFLSKYYQGAVTENSKKGTVILVVNATDGDLITSPQGYGNISYHLSGEHAFLFEINSTTGEIKVGSNNIDRERQPALNLVAVAMDTPLGGKETRKSEVPIQLDVLDVNDNAPAFKEKEYLVVTLENSPIGSSVVNVTAVDPDIGAAGIVKYDIVNEFDGSGLFKINGETGEISVQKSLTGRGRNHPYLLTVRAEDAGEPALFSDVQVSVLIGDVVANDGIPVFIHPTEDEVAYISEDAPVGSRVFQVVGADSDDPFTHEGQLQYLFLKSSPDVDAFSIDSRTGLIVTRTRLNRESKSNYSLILVIRDGGSIPQQTTRILQIRVNDTDDNVPLFKRTVDEKPLQVYVKEEVPIGTVIGTIEAIDLDEKQNAEIGYLITEGNDDKLFAITESNNTAVIESAARIDRESMSHVVLTVKCFKKRERPRMLFKKYNKTDFSERQILIKILDVDDNAPEFTEKNITVGIRFNSPVDSLLLTVTARDSDVEAGPIFFRIVNSSFFHLPSRSENYHADLPLVLNERTGEVRTNSSVRKFVDGYFSLEVAAVSGISTNSSTNIIKVFVIRERGLLRFVFSKTPSEVKENISQFKSELENALTLPSVQLNVYDTQFHSNSDGGYDFSKTSSCFQIISADSNYDAKEAETIFKDENNNQLKNVYEKYGVEAVQRCGDPSDKVNVTWVQISLLSIAAFIGITSIISSCILCCSYSR